MSKIKEIQSRVSLFCSSAGDYTPAEFVASVLCELSFVDRGIRRCEDASDYPELVGLVLRVKSVADKHDYSRKGMLDMIQHLFLSGMTLEQMKNLVRGSMIVTYPDSLDGKMLFSHKSMNPPILRRIQGKERYVPLDPSAVKSVKITSVIKNRPQPSHSNQVTNPELSPEVIALKQHYQYLASKAGDKRYFWEWKVSKTEYEKLYDLLKQARNNFHVTAKFASCCAPQIALYVAEWYKREYDGYQSGNPLEIIGLEAGNHSKTIWEHARLNPSDLFLSEDTNRHEYIYSLYLLGGFPIKYTYRSNRFKSMFDGIWGEDSDTDTISDEQITDITQGFDGNRVIKRSLLSGSLHDYYRYLKTNEDLPIAEEDKSVEPFKNFKENLLDGKDNYFRNYIRANWFLYTESGDDDIDCLLRVYFGKKDDKCYIPSGCLDFWGIPHNVGVADFRIEVSDSNYGVSKSVRFSKTGPGDRAFVGWTRKNYIETDIPYTREAAVDVNVVIGEERYRINRFRVEGCRQFYKTRSQYEWSDRTDNGTLTAVIYDPLEYTSDKDLSYAREKMAENGRTRWMWFPLSEDVTLTDRHENSVTFIPRNHLLSLSYKLVKNAIAYSNLRNVTYRRWIDGEQEETVVPLLIKDGLSVSFTPFDSNKEESVPLSSCILRFKPEGSNSYIVWDEAHAPSQGFIKLNVTYVERSISVTTTVFYLPSAVPVRRILDEGRIDFDPSIEKVYAPTESGYMKLEPTDGRIEYRDVFARAYDPESDTVPFLIGDPDSSCAVLEVYRAWEGREVFLKGNPCPIIKYTDSSGIIDVPYINRKDFRVRTINQYGVQNKNCGKNLHLSSRTEVREDEDNGINYYRFKAHGTDTRGLIQLETNPEQYRFFFWSGDVDDTPVPIETVYDENSKILLIDIHCLEQNEKGLIFQSLRGVRPRHYFRPIYGSKFRCTSRQASYEIASFHEIPYLTFGNLILYNYELLSNFFKDLLDRRNWHLTKSDCRNLHRLAEENCFDWLLIPRLIWRKKDYFCIGKSDLTKQETILELFKSAPYIKSHEKAYLERVLDLYWKLPSIDKWEFARTNSNLALQSIRGLKRMGERKRDWELMLCETFSERIEKLEAIKADESLFVDIYRVFANIKMTQ